MNRITRIILLLALAAIAIPALAGSLTPPGLPANGSGMPTTKAIFQQLSSGQVTAIPGTFQEPSAGPSAGTGRSLSEIKAKLPAADNVNGAAAGDVLSGKTFWGLRTDGTWGVNSGASTYCSENISGSWVNCLSGVCLSGTCRAASCSDTVKNSSESDVDCGGASCAKCALGKICTSGNDCASSICSGGICVGAMCVDGVKNGTETDVDCGGLDCAKCALGKICLVATDCASSVCSGGKCQ